MTVTEYMRNKLYELMKYKFGYLYCDFNTGKILVMNIFAFEPDETIYWTNATDPGTNKPFFYISRNNYKLKKGEQLPGIPVKMHNYVIDDPIIWDMVINTYHPTEETPYFELIQDLGTYFPTRKRKKFEYGFFPLSRPKNEDEIIQFWLDDDGPERPGDPEFPDKFKALKRYHMRFLKDTAEEDDFTI